MLKTFMIIVMMLFIPIHTAYADVEISGDFIIEDESKGTIPNEDAVNDYTKFVPPPVVAQATNAYVAPTPVYPPQTVVYQQQPQQVVYYAPQQPQVVYYQQPVYQQAPVYEQPTAQIYFNYNYQRAQRVVYTPSPRSYVPRVYTPQRATRVYRR